MLLGEKRRVSLPHRDEREGEKKDSPLAVDTKSKILSHNAVLVNELNAGLLEALGESDELGVVVALAHEGESTSPSIDGGDPVRAKRVSEGSYHRRGLSRAPKSERKREELTS